MREMMVSKERLSSLRMSAHPGLGVDIGTAHIDWNIYKPFDGRGLIKYFPDMGSPEKLSALASATVCVCVKFFPSDVEVGSDLGKTSLTNLW